MELKRHAQVRAQQRGIPPMVVDLLIRFGHREKAGGGLSKVFMDRSARKKVCAYAGQLASLISEHLDTYLIVMPDNTVITVGHRLERIKRH
jgi:hypothetical protein